MPLTITEASESDIDRLMEVQFAAMAQQPYHHVLFPGPNTPTMRAQAGTRTLSDWRSDPSEKVLQVIDTDTSEIISFGIWNVYLQRRSQDEWDQHMEVDWTTDPTLKEGAETYLREIHGMRHRYATEQPHLRKSSTTPPPSTGYQSIPFHPASGANLLINQTCSAQHPRHAPHSSASRCGLHDCEVGMQ